MLDSILGLIFIPFSFTPVLFSCGFAFVGSVFALIYRLMIGNYTVKR